MKIYKDDARGVGVGVMVWSPGIITGVIVAVIGVVLLLSQFDLINVGLGDLWPLILVGVGLSMMGRGHGAGGFFVGLVIVLLGVGFLAERFTAFDFDIGRLWPVAIVAVGLAIAWGSLTGSRAMRRPRGSSTADFVRRSAVLGGAELRNASADFKGGDLSAVLGGVDLDLRNASIQGEEAVIHVFACMGGIEIRVPENWSLVCDVLPLLGAVEDKTRPASDPSAQTKRLVLRGTVVMGGVELKN